MCARNKQKFIGNYETFPAFDGHPLLDGNTKQYFTLPCSPPKMNEQMLLDL